MVKPVIVKRLVKGHHLTFTELDQNFQNLDDATISIAVQGSDTVINDLNDTTTFVGQDGIQITATASNQTISFDASLYMDTTPVLSGDLDVNNFKIVNNVTNGNIELDPNGTGRVVISGDLQVDGTTTTINSTTLDVDDKNITLSKGAPNAAASDGGGITVEGPTTAATLLYASADDSWNSNKKMSAPELQVDNINVNGNALTSTDTNGNISITPNGTGNVNLETDTVNLGSTNENVVVTTNGTGDLRINTNQGTNSGYIEILDGTSGNITIQTAASGQLQLAGSASASLSAGTGSLELIHGATLGGIFINAASPTISVNTNKDLKLSVSGTGYLHVDGPLKITATSGTPTNYENGYFEDMLATPVSWLKIRIGSSDYYLPLFQ